MSHLRHVTDLASCMAHWSQHAFTRPSGNRGGACFAFVHLCSLSCVYDDLYSQCLCPCLLLFSLRKWRASAAAHNSTAKR